MKRLHLNVGSHPRRGGAVIIVVLSLMTVLMFLGMFFFFFADEARLAAENVANTQDWEDGFTLDSEKVLNHALKQVIAYTPGQYTNSALYGGQYSLLAHEIGTLNPNGTPKDLTLFNGLGVNVVATTAATDTTPADGHPDVTTQGQFFIDRNGDGAADPIPAAAQYAMNFSAIANPNPTPPQPGTPMTQDPAYNVGGQNIFANITPDAGYTYPDANSLFLAYEDKTSGVVIPSFFRPQLFPDERSSAAAQNTFSFLYNTAGPNGDYKLRVLRPHLLQTYTPISLPLNATKRQQLRYLDTQTPAQSGDRTRALQPFPFQVDVNGNGVFNEAGPLSKGSTAYEFDVDADLDGRRDSIYIDTDHPLITMPDGRQFVPIYYFKIQDADALLNVNAHGNLNRLAATEDVNGNGSLDPGEDLNGNGAIDSVTLPPSTAVSKSIHSSTLGLSVSEINPAWALTGNPKEQSAASLSYLMLQHQNMFPGFNPVAFYGAASFRMSLLATANIELAMMMFGRSDAYGSPQSLWPKGRWGADNITNPNQFVFRGPGYVNSPQTGAADDDREFAGWDYDPFADVNNDGIPDWQDLNLDGTPDAQQDLNTNTIPDWYEDPYTGTLALGGRPHFDRYLGHPAVATKLTQPPFVHPLDYRGLANYPQAFPSGTIGNAADDMRSLAGLGIGNSPAVWPNYDAKWQTQGVLAVHGVNPLLTQAALQPGSANGLVNEPNEALLNRDRRGAAGTLMGSPAQTTDALFGAQEMAALQLSDADWRRTGNDSRLRDLLSYNFENSTAAALIRSRFTTDSWDRKEFSYSADIVNRPWEFNDTTTAGQIRFPPMFTGLGTASSHENGTIVPADPFRPVLRRLLTVIESATTGTGANFGANRRAPQHKLNLNKLLVNFDQYGNPVYRELMPHPVFDPTDANDPADAAAAISADSTNILYSTNGEVRPLEHLNPVQTSQADTNSYSSFNSSAYLDRLDPNIPPLTIGTDTWGEVPLSYVSNLRWDSTNQTMVNAGLTQTQLKLAQEVWARYDRQRMARDIYVMLYTLAGYGGESNTANPGLPDQTIAAAEDTNFNGILDPGEDLNGNGTLDGATFNTTAQLIDGDVAREIAQFAVNVVDALDRDSVITRFEYDPDLSDGWNNPNGSGTPPWDSRYVVYGVERQELSFSEAVLVRVKTQNGDINSTLFNEDQNSTLRPPGASRLDEHQFLYVELRNASPFPVNLKTGTWRLVRVDPPAPPNVRTDALFSVEFKSKAPGDFKRVGAGSNFLITANDGYVVNGANQNIPADFYVDFQGTADLDSAFPISTNTVTDKNQQPLPLTDRVGGVDLGLDLAVNGRPSPSDHENYYTATPLAPRTAPAIVNAVTDQAGTIVDQSVDADFDLVLQRRLNLQGSGIGETEWVEVDRWQIRETSGPQFTFSSGQRTDAQTELQKFQSQERPQPLDSRQRNSQVSGFTQHTLNVITPDAPNNQLQVTTGGTLFTLWEPHFDRDFASVVDLLSIPLYGPIRAGTDDGNPDTQFSQLAGSTGWHFSSDGKGKGELMAKRRFLNPQDPNGGNGPANIEEYKLLSGTWGDYQNRWYRLLGFLEAQPSEKNADDLTARIQRLVAGKLNLNTIRDETVLAGLIDDDVHLNPFAGANVRATQDTLDAGRVWYDELKLRRDGMDPVTYNPPSAMTVPGLPGAKPFRDLSYLDPVLANQDQSIASTVLRTHAPVLPDLGLFDARPTTDVGTSGTFTVDFHTARRILAKVHNLTTVRSHVYIIHCGYDLFDAHQLPNGNVQIGAKSETMRGARQFLVVDMSRLEEAYNPLTNTFDFQKFIIYRQTLP